MRRESERSRGGPSRDGCERGDAKCCHSLKRTLERWAWNCYPRGRIRSNCSNVRHPPASNRATERATNLLDHSTSGPTGWQRRDAGQAAGCTRVQQEERALAVRGGNPRIGQTNKPTTRRNGLLIHSASPTPHNTPTQPARTHLESSYLGARTEASGRAIERQGVRGRRGHLDWGFYATTSTTDPPKTLRPSCSSTCVQTAATSRREENADPK